MKRSIHFTVPFVVVQRAHYDFLTGDSDLFTQAANQPEDPVVQRQHMHIASWFQDIFSSKDLRDAVGLENFFSCGRDRDMSLSFRFVRMDEAATHAVFLMQQPPRDELRSRGMLDRDPSTAGYPGLVSLERNRGVWYGKAMDQRYFELYSASLLQLANPVVIGKEPTCKGLQ